MLKGVNWVGVVVAVVLLEGLGMLWFGPLFGPAWTAAMPIAPDPSGMAMKMSLGVVNTLVVVLGLAWLVRGASLGSALTTSLAAWFFFAFTTEALEYLYMSMSPTLVAINMGYLLASFLIAGACLSLIRIGARAPAAAAAA